jgi:Polyketide cyclase / dehydrase and lipid transport
VPARLTSPRAGAKVTVIMPIVIIVLAVVALFIVVVATRPAQFHLERSISVAAPPEKTFVEVNDFHRWAAWSPWEKMDPDMKKTFSGAATGAGSRYAWVGNSKVGEGRMTIDESVEPSVVKLTLEFLKPWKATNVTTFSFIPDATGTKVTWAMDGRHVNFGMKAFALVVSMDKLVGRDFERGLAALKTIAERA